MTAIEVFLLSTLAELALEASRLSSQFLAEWRLAIEKPTG